MKRVVLAGVFAVMPWIGFSQVQIGLWSLAFLLVGLCLGISLMGEQRRWLRIVGIAEVVICAVLAITSIVSVVTGNRLACNSAPRWARMFRPLRWLFLSRPRTNSNGVYGAVFCRGRVGKNPQRISASPEIERASIVTVMAVA